ncbi:hypothetical protein GCM10022219_15190 [Microbacterium oryzae]|nr:alpha-galactosidase [Microbacterium oryzae]
MGTPAYGSETVASGDATVSFDAAAEEWTLETDDVRRVIKFADGSLTQTELVSKETGRDYQQRGVSTEFRVRVDGADLRGSSGGWGLDGHETAVEPNGAVHLTLTLSRPGIRVDRQYWLYPDTSFIEERTDVTNTGSLAVELNDFSAVSMRVLGDDAEDVDMYAINGDKASAATYQTLKGPIPMASGLQNPGGRGGNVHQPFVTLHDREAAEGIAVTWDYTGNWVMNVGDSYGKILVEPRATLATALAPGNEITGPVGRVGFYQGDLDDMGNSILDFTYRYLWDDTSDEYFPLIRYGGYGSTPDIIGDKIRQLAYIGGDMVWMDDGWQDAMGDWNAKPGEPLREYRDFAAMHGMQMGYWLVPWGAEGKSQIAAQHPDWMLNAADRKAGLDTINPEVRAHIDSMLQDRQEELGPFMLKTDFGADSGNLEKANATMDILQEFVDHNPQAGLQLCSDGGGLMNLRTVALSDLALQRDGTPGREDGYWTSMMYPTEKLIASYGRGDVGKYSKSNRHLLSFHFTIAGDTTAPDEALEPLRVDAEIYRYLASQGVMGRWVEVYRPTSDSGSVVGILQKMSGDGERGYITFPKAAFALGSAVTLKPKGLEPDHAYTVASQEGSVPTQTRSGADWMRDGIDIGAYVEGEILYFNLENRPGAGTDEVAPTPAAEVRTALATRLGEDGVELTWKAGADDRWLSHYAIWKNGEPYTKVSSGEYFFDAGAAVDDVYEVRAVDGDGNVSAGAVSTPLDPEAPARAVLSTTSGWASGLHDGTYDVKMDLWWGQNAREFRLYENGDLLTAVPLTPDGRQAQHAAVPIAGRGNGTYVYTGELRNAAGGTETSTVTVEVTDAAPAKPALRIAGEDAERVALTDLWWGTNATAYRLLVDGEIVDEQDLTARSPQAQHVETVLGALGAGRHELQSVLVNTAGETRSDPVVVEER